MKDSIFLLILFIFIGTATSGQESLEKLLSRYNSHSIPYISVKELASFKSKNNLILLDAREKTEFKVSHIPLAKNIGFEQFSSEDKLLQKIKKNAHIIVYCSIGIRSEEIAEKLKKLGFTNVDNLYGGIFEWKNNGFKVVDSTGRETENIHTFSKKWSKWLHSGNPIY